MRWHLRSCVVALMAFAAPWIVVDPVLAAESATVRVNVFPGIPNYERALAGL